MSEAIKKFLSLVVFLILPIIVLISGALYNVKNTWFYVLSISWFGLGLITILSIEDL